MNLASGSRRSWRYGGRCRVFGIPLFCVPNGHHSRCRDLIPELARSEWGDASLRSIRKNISIRKIASTKASGTTYNVPKIKRGKSCPKISHIANACRTKQAIQKIQNSHELRFALPKTRTPNSAQKVHMIAACHLCGALPLSRIIAANNTRATPIQPKASSLVALFLFNILGIFDTACKRYRWPGAPDITVLDVWKTESGNGEGIESILNVLRRKC